MKKSTAIAAIAASTFVIGAYAEQDHKVTTSVAEAHEQQSAQSIVDDLGFESGTYEPVSYTHLTLPTNREV